MSKLFFITHPEVVIDPDVTITQWSLSKKGKERMHALLRQPWVQDAELVYSSTEQKAIDGAVILVNSLDVPHYQLEELGEIDRSSTGYIGDGFWEVVERFFSRPAESPDGWERAVDAQERIVEAVEGILHLHPDKDIAVVSHGAVGALLLAKLTDQKIEPSIDQPGDGGGNYFVIDTSTMRVVSGWQAIDA